MISVPDNQDIVIDQVVNSASNIQFSVVAREGESSLASASLKGRLDTVFPVPGLILNELFQLYKNKTNLNERNSAIMDYIRLIFPNIR